MRPLADQSPLPPSCVLTAAADGATKEQRAALILACDCTNCLVARLIVGLQVFAMVWVAGLAGQES